MRTVFALFIALILAGCDGDVLESSYASYSDVLKDGAIERGWIPEWLPATAVNIKELHNIDTNESTLVFKLPAEQRWSPGTYCRPAHAGQFYESPFSREWIPRSIDGFHYFSCTRDVTVGSGTPPMVVALAISKDHTTVVHWRYVSP